jgi:hypothetical protein
MLQSDILDAHWFRSSWYGEDEQAAMVALPDAVFFFVYTFGSFLGKSRPPFMLRPHRPEIRVFKCAGLKILKMDASVPGGIASDHYDVRIVVSTFLALSGVFLAAFGAAG